MRLSGILVLATALVFGVSGCGAGDESESDGEIGAAASAVLSASSTSVVFTSEPKLCPAFATVTISNPGATPETISSVVVSNGNFSSGGLPGTIAGGASAPLNLTFRPRVVGTVTGTVTITSTNGGVVNTLVINLQGTGFPPGPC